MSVATIPVTFRARYPRVTESDLVDPRVARAAWDAYRIHHGYAAGAPLLTPPSANLKLGKGNVPTYGWTMSPARTSGVNLCRASTRECRDLCLATAGNGRYDSTAAARILRARFWLEHPAECVSLLRDELLRARARHRDAWRVGIRWNVLSDIPWEICAPVLVEPIGRIRAYDYTKDWARVGTDRYTLTYSRSEITPDADVITAVESGRNVAVAFSTARTRALPRTYLGLPVIDGDTSDYRPGDRAGVIVGLRAKGRARMARFRGGFVVDANGPECAS